MSSLVVGVDPGVTTGIMALLYADGALCAAPISVQVIGHHGVVPLVNALFQHYPLAARQLLAVEQFVVGPRSVKSASARAGVITRELIGELLAMPMDAVVLPAGVVKPWATDRRLEAAGLITATISMHHARDAARHALFAAVKNGIAPDPLSARAHRA